MTARLSRNTLATLAALAIVLVGLNLRPSLAAIGPLLDDIRSATGLSYQGAGLATSLPIMAMGVLALCGTAVYRLGVRRGIAIGLTLVLVASLARYFLDSGASLLVTALAAGAGIGLVQTLMPGFIKKHFPAQVDRLMGLYITAIMGGAALAAMSAPALLPAVGWQSALAVWALPAALGLLLWWLATRRMPDSPLTAQRPATGVSTQRRAWTLAAVFGVETGCYTLLLAWLAPYYLQLGWSAQQAGTLLAGLTAFEVIAGLGVAAFASRWHDRRVPLVLCVVLGVAGFICLLSAPVTLAWMAVALLGLGIGALFPLTLILTLDHSSDSRRAGVLAAFVQGVGYLIAGTMPFLAGLLRDQFGSFDLAWAAIAVALALTIPVVLRLSPSSTTRFDLKHASS